MLSVSVGFRSPAAAAAPAPALDRRRHGSPGVILKSLLGFFLLFLFS